MIYQPRKETYGLDKLNWGAKCYFTEYFADQEFSPLAVRMAYRTMKESSMFGPEQIAALLIESYNTSLCRIQYQPTENDAIVLQAGYRLFQDLVVGPVGLWDLMRALGLCDDVYSKTTKYVNLGHQDKSPRGPYSALNVARILGWLKTGRIQSKRNGDCVDVFLAGDKHAWGTNEYFAEHTKRRPDQADGTPYGWKAIER